MTKSAVTKNYQRKAIILSILSWLLCFGLCFAFVIMGIQQGWGADPGSFAEKIGSIAYGFLASNIVLVILAIIVKDKIRPTVWMADVVLAAYFVGNAGMWTVFGIWVLDQYVFTPLRKKWGTQYLINKEIDKRNE